MPATEPRRRAHLHRSRRRPQLLFGGFANATLPPSFRRSPGQKGGHRPGRYRKGPHYVSRSSSLLAEFFGEPDENSFGPPDVAEPIRVFVLDHVIDDLRPAFAEPGERIVDVLH